jgi:hypothetical protein
LERFVAILGQKGEIGPKQAKSLLAIEKFDVSIPAAVVLTAIGRVKSCS